MLENLLDHDQKYRESYHSVISQYGYQSDSIRKAIRLMTRTDSINQLTLALVVDKYGWPSQKEYGDKAVRAAFYVTIHAPLDFQKKYLPLLKEKSRLKEINEKHYQVIYDRILLTEGKSQCYGTHQKVNGQIVVDAEENNGAVKN